MKKIFSILLLIMPFIAFCQENKVRLPDLPEATSLTDGDLFYVVQGNVSKNVTKANLLNGIDSDSVFIAVLYDPQTAVPTPTEGMLYYNSTAKQFRGWNGTQWDTLNIASTTSPTDTTYFTARIDSLFEMLDTVWVKVLVDTLGEASSGQGIRFADDLYFLDITDNTTTKQLYIDPTTREVTMGDLPTVEAQSYDSISFNINPPESSGNEGVITWNSKKKTLNIPSDGDHILQPGHEEVTRIYNNTGSTILNFTPVRPVGIHTDGTVTVTPANNETHEGFAGKLALSTEDIADGSYGAVALRGELSGNTLGMGWSIGDTLWLDTTAANRYITTTRPEFPFYIQQLGQVTWIASDTGTIELAIQDDASSSLDNFHNGSFRESFDFRTSSDGAIVTGSLSPSNGNVDMTMIFSSGLDLFDTSPTATISLTPGTNINPQTNYVYIPESTKALTVSTSDWPSTEHIKVATVVLQTAAYTQTYGAIRNQNHNDHVQGDNGQGHMTHMAERIRQEHSKWYSGAEGTLTIGSGPTPDTVNIAVTGGVIYQMHRQSFPAMNTSEGDYVFIVNNSTTAYLPVNDLNGQILDANGVSLGNKYFNFVLWGVANKTGEESQLMINLPVGSYSNLSYAETDISNYSIYDIPTLFKGVGFLIAEFTLQLNASANAWTLHQTKDLRGKVPSTSAGGSGGTGASTYLGLTDTPANYSGEAYNLIQVNSGETALEFTNDPILDSVEVQYTSKLGTVISGEWNGTAVADGYVADDITLMDITQVTGRSHTDLSDIGTNSHAEIDEQLEYVRDTIEIIVFGAGSGAAGDTVVFSTDRIYGSFKNDQDTIVVTKMSCVLQGTSPSLTVDVQWHATLNSTSSTHLNTTPPTITTTTTTDDDISFNNAEIPPGRQVWCETPTVTTKPTYMSVTIIGYRK